MWAGSRASVAADPMFLGRFRARSRVPLAEQRFQNFLQSAAAAQNA
jgi:hypothetical protein